MSDDGTSRSRLNYPCTDGGGEKCARSVFDAMLSGEVFWLMCTVAVYTIERGSPAGYKDCVKDLVSGEM
jgi:hypothetical protein